MPSSCREKQPRSNARPPASCRRTWRKSPGHVADYHGIRGCSDRRPDRAGRLPADEEALAGGRSGQFGPGWDRHQDRWPRPGARRPPPPRHALRRLHVSRRHARRPLVDADGDPDSQAAHAGHPPLDVAYAPKVIDRATRYLELSDGCFTDHSLVTEDEQRAMGIFSAAQAERSRPLFDSRRIRRAQWADRLGAHLLSNQRPAAAVKILRQASRVVQPDQRRAEEENSQLCLTNDQMREEMVRVVNERIRAIRAPR